MRRTIVKVYLCQKCGQEFKGGRHPRKLCGPCLKLVKRESARQARLHCIRSTNTLKCLDCSVDFESKAKNALRCRLCRRELVKKSCAAYYLGKKPDYKKPELLHKRENKLTWVWHRARSDKENAKLKLESRRRRYNREKLKILSMSDEEKQLRLVKRRSQSRQAYQRLSVLEKREWSIRCYEYRKRLMANMSGFEKFVYTKKLREKDRAWLQARVQKMTPDEFKSWRTTQKEKRRQRNQFEKARGSLANLAKITEVAKTLSELCAT